jgi:hypothetical protein
MEVPTNNTDGYILFAQKTLAVKNIFIINKSLLARCLPFSGENQTRGDIKQ